MLGTFECIDWSTPAAMCKGPDRRSQSKNIPTDLSASECILSTRKCGPKTKAMGGNSPVNSFEIMATDGETLPRKIGVDRTATK